MSEQRNDQPVEAFRAAGVVMMTIVVIFGLLGFGVWKMKDLPRLEDAVKLPLLVIAGLVSLIALLAVMAIAFKTVHLANQTQALGLPDGTVRAVIALSLILIFSVVTVYLFSDLSDMDSVSCQELKELKDQIAKSTGKPLAPATATDTTGTNPATGTNPPTTTNPPATSLSPADTRRQSNLTASQDFAKQLLIMLGTLITSITSFYFASRTADASSGKPTTPLPTQPTMTLTGVTPPKAPKGALPEAFTATGSGLLSVNAISLRSKTVTVDITGADVLSSDTTVQFKAPKDLASDTWDVVAKSREGTQVSLSGAIQIT